MTYDQIAYLAPINDIDNSKVRALVESMLQHGWVGCPILIYGDSLLTGSHRLAALQLLAAEYEDAEVLSQDVAADVTDIIEERLAKFEADNGYTPDIEYDNIGWLLEGTWVEDYRDEIVEW